MKSILEKQVKEIIDLFSNNNSVLETAKAAGVSTVKVRKILITEGLWESDTSIQIGTLLKQGFTTREIADKLYMSVKNVQAYMPYERGVYCGDEQSLEAVRSDKYRKRMKRAAAAQVVKKTEIKHKSERVKEMADDKVIEFKRTKKKDKPDVLKLHLELDMTYVNEEEINTLKKYASMKKTLSRDILVPADITLHALNYAILRMFGWQNGHLHNFSLPRDVYEALTENQFMTWAKMVGVYFRFPTEDYEDIYWDDDYTEGQSVKSWMKKKYTGPYRYKGRREHYVNGQMEVKDMLSRWDEITVHEYNFNAKKQPEPYNVKLAEATIDQVMHAFADIMCYELIERLPLLEILRVPNTKKVDFVKVRNYVDQELSKRDVADVIELYQNQRFSSKKKEQEYLAQYDIAAMPVTDILCYSYDYGDGWEVLIHCEEAYYNDDEASWRNAKGEKQDALTENLEEVMEKHRPVCIAKDGIELVDDVGGIGGFCQMLRTIYECNGNDEEESEERESMIGWADMMGWNGRKVSPKQTL